MHSLSKNILAVASRAPRLPCPQVQLLVQDSDVESYKQIKEDLDDLRNLVEKSELWVYKGRSTEAAVGKNKKKKKKDEDEERE